MPRDDSAPGDAAETSDMNNAKAPLKRGDACLYCRKRRIRCSADKPTCQHCRKLKRECVYDSGKPVSRVKQLEDKVAELEGMLRGTPSSSMPPQPPPPPLAHHSSSSSSQQGVPYNNMYGTADSNNTNTNTNNNNSFDVNMLDSFPTPSAAFGGVAYQSANPFFAAFGSSVTSGEYGTTGLTPQVVSQQNAQQSFDFSMLDPGFANLLSSFQTTANIGPSNVVAAPPPAPAPAPPPPLPQPAVAAPPAPSMAPTGYYPPNGDANLFSASSSQSPAAVPISRSSFDHTAVLNSMCSEASDFPASSDPSPAAASSSHRSSYSAYVSDAPEPLQPTYASTFGTTHMSSTGESLVADGGNSIVAQTIGVKDGRPLGASADPTGWEEFRTQQGFEEPGLSLVGGWFDAADLPRVARDHLLDIFFTNMPLFGQEFHVPRFFASLSLPVAKRPHPCLLYSMFLLASRLSLSPPIRALEPHFYSIASKQLEESISRADRLLDATRAATILAVYKYSLARYHEGWMMTGQACRLAVSCGLHQIPSGVFKAPSGSMDPRADLVGIMRARTYVLGAPKDAIELGERIWAFHSVYTTDRCGAIAAQWPVGIPDNVVTTPYPRPLHEYELGLVTHADDISVSSIYSRTPAPALPPYSPSTHLALRVRGLTLLERASKLMYLPPEPDYLEKLSPLTSTTFGGNHIPSPSSVTSSTSGGSGQTPPDGIDEYLSYQNYTAAHPQSAGASPSARHAQSGYARPYTSASGEGPDGSWTGQKGKGWMRCARVRNPAAYEEIRLALLRVEDDLPMDRRTAWEAEWDGKLQDWHFAGKGQGARSRQDTISLHFILGCAWMFLFDVYSFMSENTRAVGVARRLVCAIKAVDAEDMLSEMDVFIAMTWSFIVKILIREAKRLRLVGDNAAAQSLEGDVEVVVSALKTFGRAHNIAAVQAMRAERYRKSTQEDMRDMAGDPDRVEEAAEARTKWGVRDTWRAAVGSV